MTKHKHQHYIPASYLEAWCDKNTPAGQTPFVWRFTRDGEKIDKKAPQRIFYETDIYTILSPGGLRNLEIEYTLSRLESEFAKIRTHKLNKKQEITEKEHLYLCLFTAAMYARTKAFGEFQSKQWKKVVDMADKVQSAFEKLSPEQQKKMSTALASPYANEENRMSIDEARDLMENPITSLLPGYTETLAPMLFESPFIILNTMDDIGFITSDNPCVWFDIANYQKPRPLGAGGMISPTLEITFPLSPHQMLLFKKKLVVSGAYIEINDNETIDTINNRTRYFSKEYFISNCANKNPKWF